MGVSSQQGVFGLKTQTARGVAATNIGTTGLAMYRTGGSMTPNRELMIPDAEIGGGRDVPDALLGPISFGGDIEYYTRFNSIGILLKAALGAPVSAAGTSTGTTVHTFTPTDATTLPFLTVYERIGADLERILYTDVVVNTLHLESDADGYLTGTAGLIACRGLFGTPDVDVSDVLDETTITVGTNIQVLYDGANIKPKSFSIDINNNFEDDDFRLGSFYLEDLTPKRREVNGSLTLRHETKDLMRQALLGSSSATLAGGLTTKKPIEIQIDTYGEIEGSAPATPYSLNLEFGKTVFEPFGFEPSGDDILESDVTFQALRPVATDPVMTATLTNGLAAIP
ncbi:major tail protein [Gordonia phage Flakey]|uniref:Major tail protein n=2 Tax=Montyvirus TaxID=2733196 RepID=A0A2K9VDI3_9CAUD|nr:major tail protein [Gordonia phage Flakey]AUV60320.1 major tail protein [Gordonia phage Flakey]QIQ62728.1 major tail protein [Gordonia phage Breezic]